MIKVTDQNFKASVNEGLVLVDFWAEWCAPCQMLGAVLQELDTEKTTAIQLAKLNIEENPQMTHYFNVMSIPTMILFKDGKPVEKIAGYHPKEVLSEYLKNKAAQLA
ncbi:thioredoxin [Isobaculum melis]|uniref:Thioredoxin n=1 Tax=Isobaculum melis TaxID=142588 RepID=A0A1H9QHS3_9LACT|nr:thioredoxin [Isobaculum melis]SER59980.1 thioredoxin [Isobaculum melis]